MSAMEVDQPMSAFPDDRICLSCWLLIIVEYLDSQTLYFKSNLNETYPIPGWSCQNLFAI